MFFPLKSCLASDSERVSSKALDVKCDGLVQLISEGDLAEPRQCLHCDHCVLCKIQIGTTVKRIKTLFWHQISQPPHPTIHVHTSICRCF